MKSLLILLFLASGAQAQVSGRALMTCDKNLRIERNVLVSSFTAVQMFSVNNSSGTFLSGAKKRCFFNEDVTAANLIRISTHAVALAEGTAAAVYTSADNTGYPVAGNSESCFDWGPNIKTYVRRSVNSAGAAVTGYACE